jgi:ketol-acid reductoisomerase
MTKIFREADANPDLLADRTIAVIGYGNQGRAQALNLRDSGQRVLVGNIDDDYRATARADGFEVRSIAQSVAEADVVLLLVPDEIMPNVFRTHIAPHVRRGSMIAFASGFNVAFEHITCPADVDVVLLAPRMIGAGVRRLYQQGAGFYSFVAVHQDATGKAQDLLLALCHAVGTLKKGAVQVTFRMEAELDLFNEQGFGPAFGKVLLSAIETLCEAGYPQEVVLLEMYLSGELAFIFEKFTRQGLVQQLDDHSATSQYGALSRGVKYWPLDVKGPMRSILSHIQNGGFAREWIWEQRLGKPRLRLLRLFARLQPIRRIDLAVRKLLGLIQ